MKIKSLCSRQTHKHRQTDRTKIKQSPFLVVLCKRLKCLYRSSDWCFKPCLAEYEELLIEEEEEQEQEVQRQIC